MDQVSEIREKIDLVNLINSYVPLKKMGANFKGLCPFHGEKTPSFVVSPERQIWHCFGCGKGGDAFGFIMEYEKVEFPESLRILADKAGVQLKQFSYDSSSKKEKIYELNILTAKFYNYILTEHAVGKIGLDYVKNREVSEKTIKTFQIGFAPPSGNALVKYLIEKKKYKAEDLIDAGLAIRTSSGLRDFFIGRLMFALVDSRNNVIGFSGRVLDPNIKASKYINTKETLVYHKGSVFFGLNIAKEAIKKEDKAIIMEGEFDVITAFQNGIANAVAIKGTALTESQAKLLARFTTNVSLCLDQDPAGIEAMKRSIPILERVGLNTTVIETPNGKDPDEALKTDSIGFKKAVKDGISIYEALINWSLKKDNPDNVSGKKNIADSLLPTFANISNEIIKDHYLRKLSEILDISLDVLNREMERLSKKELVGKEEIIAVETKKKSRQEILEEYVTALVVQSKNPKKSMDSVNNVALDFDWSTESFKKILLFIKNLQNVDIISGKNLYQLINDELKPAFDISFLLPLSEMEQEIINSEIKKSSRELANILIRNKIKEETKSLQIAEKAGNSEEMDRMEKNLSNLAISLSQVSN